MWHLRFGVEYSTLCEGTKGNMDIKRSLQSLQCLSGQSSSVLCFGHNLSAHRVSFGGGIWDRVKYRLASGMSHQCVGGTEHLIEIDTSDLWIGAGIMIVLMCCGRRGVDTRNRLEGVGIIGNLLFSLCGGWGLGMDEIDGLVKVVSRRRFVRLV
ncbi:hypothetical protein Tco_0407386 [Tanacetum coccineum]